MATVIVGALNKQSICRVETDSKGIDDPKYAEFDIPSRACPIEPGSPKWANYVKGVVAEFHDGSMAVNSKIQLSTFTQDSTFLI